MVLTLQAPFTYEALPPEKINFVPLKQKKSFNAKELMQVLMPTVCLSSVDLATMSYSLAILSDMLAYHCLKQAGGTGCNCSGTVSACSKGCLCLPNCILPPEAARQLLPPASRSASRPAIASA